jgi:hypothetical protein
VRCPTGADISNSSRHVGLPLVHNTRVAAIGPGVEALCEVNPIHALLIHEAILARYAVSDARRVRRASTRRATHPQILVVAPNSAEDSAPLSSEDHTKPLI